MDVRIPFKRLFPLVDIRASLTRIQAQIAREQYRRALREVERFGLSVLEKAGPSQDVSDLLLLIANAYYVNRRYGPARRYLSELDLRYPAAGERNDVALLRLKLLLREGLTQQARSVLETIFKESLSQENSMRYLFFRGLLHVHECNYLNANRDFLSCHRHGCSTEDGRIQGDALYMLGYVAFRRSLFDIAEEYFCEAAENFGADGRSAMSAAAFRLRGVAAGRRASYESARQYLERSIQLYRTCIDRRGKIVATIEMARILVCCDECELAERRLLKAIHAAQKLDFGNGIVRACVLLADHYNQQQKHGEALRCLQTAERSASAVEAGITAASEYLRVKGEALLGIGQRERAAEQIGKALEIASETGAAIDIGTSMRSLACLSIDEDIDRAIACFDESIIFLERCRNSFELLRTCMVAGRACMMWGRDEKIPKQNRLELLRRGRRYILRAIELCQLHGPRTRRICDAVLERIELECDLLKVSTRNATLDFDASSLHYGMVIACSIQMKEVISKVRELAPSTVPVLITGETGTGKEVIARLLHRLSERSEGPFIAVNCASIPDAVFESELFGYKRGSFTGAFKDKMGLIEEASGGTIFLDEISELSNQQQAKLLRALQDGMIRRVGETIERPIDVRVISASNEDIDMLRRSNRLREDFYYRISIATIELAPLRERKEDIPALFAYYLRIFGGRCAVEEGVLELFKRYSWPGNVRELLGIVRVIALQGRRQGLIHVHDLPLRMIHSSVRAGKHDGKRKRAHDAFTLRITKNACMKNPREMRELIQLYLDKYRGNKSAVARELGISRCTLYRRLKELKIQPKEA